MGKVALAVFIVAAFIVVVFVTTRKPVNAPVASAPAQTTPARTDVKTPAVRTLTMEEAHANLLKNRNIVMLDVRTPEEYAKEHIPGTKLLPIAEPEVFGPQVLELIPDKSATVYAFCRTGRRSETAAEIMQKLGYTNVYNIGGIIDWKYELETSE